MRLKNSPPGTVTSRASLHYLILINKRPCCTEEPGPHPKIDALRGHAATHPCMPCRRSDNHQDNVGGRSGRSPTSFGIVLPFVDVQLGALRRGGGAQDTREAFCPRVLARFRKSHSRIGLLILIESLVGKALKAVRLRGGAERAHDKMATPESMTPTLQVMNGTTTGRLYQLDKEITIVGRNPDCDIVLAPKSVSRKHAVIVRKLAGYELKDLGSTRGTYVDGQKLSQPVFLRDGNAIQMGEVLLNFTSRLVQIEEGDEQSTVFAAIDVLNQSDKNFPMVKPEAKFRALRLIGQELGGTLVLTEVLERIFNSLFEIFPRAERGFVLLKDETSGALLPQIIRSRTGPAGDLKISKTVLNRVMNAGQAILSKDLAEEFPDSASVSDSKIRSLMCVPLFDEERKAVGIMQIDTRDGRGRFEQDDLDLMAAVASQISVAVQNAQLHKALVRQREMEQELQFARQVMQSLLPDRPASVPGYEFWAYYEPARHVGGDYYGFIPMPATSGEDEASASRWAIAVGDVVGKGMPAALLDRQALRRGAHEPARQPRPQPRGRSAQSSVRRRRARYVHHVPARHPRRSETPSDRRQRRSPVSSDHSPRRPIGGIRPKGLRIAPGNLARLRLRIRRDSPRGRRNGRPLHGRRHRCDGCQRRARRRRRRSGHAAESSSGGSGCWRRRRATDPASRR